MIYNIKYRNKYICHLSGDIRCTELIHRLQILSVFKISSSLSSSKHRINSVPWAALVDTQVDSINRPLNMDSQHNQVMEGLSLSKHSVIHLAMETLMPVELIKCSSNKILLTLRLMLTQL